MSAAVAVSLRQHDLQRIEVALERGVALALELCNHPSAVSFKQGDDPVTALDHALNRLLLETLPADGEGWLSEETGDDLRRLSCRRVWVVDPLDGTREFVARIPEWCISIGLVEDGRAVAGGIANPATGELVVGSLETGVTLNSVAVQPSTAASLRELQVLASRSETKRGEWRRFGHCPFQVRPMGSVAYKLALVAAGRAHATWTLVPKHEWDVAAGIALVRAAGGVVTLPSGEDVQLNRPDALLPGLLAFGSEAIADRLRPYANATQLENATPADSRQASHSFRVGAEFG